MNVSFAEHVALFSEFLARRDDGAGRIEQHLLNVQGKDTSRRRDRAHFDSLLNSCFFALPGLPSGSSRLKGQLAARHLADGFEPIPLDRFSHELDPLELILRAYQHWDRHRWPGRSGRLSYAHTIYSVFMLRQLEALSLRIWDEGPAHAGDRLDEVQRLLDQLNAPPRLGSGPTDVLVRDARWLVHTAQGPLTRHLEPYLKIAAQISESFTAEFRLGVHKAGARLAGGHLRSQLRYRVWETGQPIDIDDAEILAVTRNSNSMDGALLVRDLVPLLEAYEQACSTGARDDRLELVDAILQGLSSDPELLLTRLDLLAPLSTIEELFVTRNADGAARYAAMGEAHVALLERYGALIGRLAAPLKADAETLDPARHIYSPFGIVYGFSADVLSNMAHCRLLGEPSSNVTLEDMFVSQGNLEGKLAHANRWAKLPTRPGEREHFEHSLEWAGEMFARLMDALAARARRPGELNASTNRSAFLLVVPHPASDEDLEQFLSREPPPALAQEYCVTSDVECATSTGATSHPRSQIVTDRREARFLASCEWNSHWFGISKVVLTEHTSHGADVLFADVPPALVDVLRLTCPGLVVAKAGREPGD